MFVAFFPFNRLCESDLKVQLKTLVLILDKKSRKQCDFLPVLQAAIPAVGHLVTFANGS
jgi:hypothetical protein